MYRTSRGILLIIAELAAIALVVIAVSISGLQHTLNHTPGLNDSSILLLISAATIQVGVIYLAAYHTGLNQGLTVFRLRRKLTRQLIDAKYYVDGFFYNSVQLPRIIIELDESELTGKVQIENLLKFRQKLDSDLSMAFGIYSVEAHYLSDNGNWFIYEIVRSDIDRKLRFGSADSFQQYTKEYPAYALFVDQALSYTLCHTLITGQTGAGKSYAVYSLIFQLLCKCPEIRSHLYFGDPKYTGLRMIGNRICPDNTAADFDAICDLLRTFDEILRKRNTEVSESLKEKLDGDYMTLNLLPEILIFEEFGAFQATLQTKEKKLRDEINAILERIIFMGRQSGCFLIVISQQVSATTLPTKIRDNIGARFLLAKGLERETAVCCFGQIDAADLPTGNYQPGEAFYKVSGLTAKPKKCVFPLLNFNAEEAIHTYLRDAARPAQRVSGAERVVRM